MHGEYKMPGGKLVVVDLDVRDETIRNVRITGDFFLYPDDALDAIAGGLEGAPAAASTDSYRELIAGAIPAGTELVGFSAEGIAIAAARALQAGEEVGDVG